MSIGLFVKGHDELVQYAAHCLRQFQRESCSDPEDLVSDAIIDFAEGRFGFVGSSDEGIAFLKRVLRNRARHLLRIAHRDIAFEEGVAAPLSTGHAPDRYAERTEMAAAVHAALDNLPPKMRRTAKLHLLEGWTAREAASQLMIAHETARTHLRQARRRLRMALVRFKPGG